jgi:60 kDa SS-A/Ro ribonucleoprotein
MQNYGKHVSTKKTPQSEKIPGSNQVRNSGGGFSWEVDNWTKLDRFLILGTEGGSYYASERKMTQKSAAAAEACLKEDGQRVVRRVVEVSKEGRAPKNDPAIFVLAMAAKLGDDETRKAAYAALPEVCRIPTHLAHFAEYVKAFGGWGRGLRKAFARWYNRPANKVAYQLVKYQSRDGWANADLIRKAHVVPATPDHSLLFRWAGAPYNQKLVDPQEFKGETASSVPEALRIVWAFEQAKKVKSVKELVKLIQEYDLPREALPTEFLTKPEIWAALLPKMGLTAMLRNLANMTRIGLLKPLSAETKLVVEKLGDQEELRSARIHPIHVLTALLTYKAGRGQRSGNSWNPVNTIVDALDKAFYLAFKNVEPTGKRMLLALDVSGSMDGGEVAGVIGLTPRVASAAMALVTAATESQYQMIAFSTGSASSGMRGARGDLNSVTTVNITPRDRLDTAVAKSSKLAMGMSGTDCALPMLWAEKNKVDVDTFVVYTDSETWAGSIHPSQALKQYRQKTGIRSRLVVCGMVANDFSIADPNDPGMLDVVGFDTAAPQLIADFSRG